MVDQRVRAQKPDRTGRNTPPILFEKTQRVLGQIESRLGERVLTYWNSPNWSICSNDVIGLYGILRSIGKVDAEMGQRAATDFDERNSHDESILNIIEGKGLQIFFQNDKAWHYRTEERRWVALNDKGSWRKAELAKGKLTVSVFHVR